jgi:hypothetical protein
MKIRNLLFIHIPRTAGTHFEKALGFKGHDTPPRCGSIAYGADYENVMGWDKKTKLMLQHATYEQLIKHKFIVPDDNLIKFTVIRNPRHRVASLFKYFGGEAKWKNFENFLSHLEDGGINGYFYMPQWKYIQGAEFNTIKFENFLPDVEMFKKKYDLKFNITFKSGLQSKKSQRTLNEYYSMRGTAERVNKLYKKDFELFGY